MDDFNIMYEKDIYDSSDYDEQDNINDEEEKHINNDELKDKNYNLVINSLDREWWNLHKDTFFFNIKFNNLLNTKIGNYHGSSSLCLPVDIKNIVTIEISKILMPVKNVYLENGSFQKIINLSGISLTIDEFDNICYGSNNILNKSFCNLIPLSPVYTNDLLTKYIEFKNINKYGKEFYPAPLNTINTLTFKMFDLDGLKLNYLNDSLTLKNINLLNGSDFIEIITNEYFSRLNYNESDVVIFKNININNSLIKDYLLNNSHSIYYENTFTRKTNLNTETLINKFFIRRKGKFTNADFIIDSGFVNTSGNIQFSMSGNEHLGNVLNKDLQIKVFMNIKTKEKDIKFNTELI